MNDVNTYSLSKLKLDKTPRPQQTELLDFTIEAIQDNKKFIMMDSPTGCLTKNEKINIYIIKDIHINDEST